MIAQVHFFTPPAPTLPQLQARFLMILPLIQRHARMAFRHVCCRQRHADCLAETIALSWRWFLDLARRGKDATRFPVVLASYAARSVRCGRRVCGQIPAQDVMSEVAQQRHGFAVGKLPDCATLDGNPLMEALQDNTRTPPPDAAAFRIDWPAWLITWSDRDRRLIQAMALGERDKDLAKQFGLSPGRLSQLRRQFHESWTDFVADPPAMDNSQR